MSKQHKIVRSTDATTLIIEGDKRNPEPSHAIIRFPGGFVEVARCSDNSYWVHVRRNTSTNGYEGEYAGTITGSRIDTDLPAPAKNVIDMPDEAHVIGYSLRIALEPQS